MLQTIYQRNLMKYGDKFEFTIDYHRNVQDKFWNDIIESASKPEGKDLKF